MAATTANLAAAFFTTTFPLALATFYLAASIFVSLALASAVNLFKVANAAWTEALLLFALMAALALVMAASALALAFKAEALA